MIWAILYFMAVVYKHIRKDTNEVFYIGIGKTEKRAYNKIYRSSYWKRIVEKHGYDIVLVETDISWETACEMETKLIKQYGRKDLGEGSLVNMTDGGNGSIGKIFTSSYRSKMSESAKLRGANHTKPHSTDTKQKMSSSHKNMSNETKQKMSNTRTGMRFSEETKQKMREAKLGRVVSDETKEKIRIGNIKTKNLKK
jgi:hypothetical protein